MPLLKYLSDEWWDSMADPKLNHATPGSPLKILVAIAFYLVIVLKIGPEMMKNRKPYKCTEAIKFYNISNVIINLMVFLATFFGTRFTMDMWDCNYVYKEVDWWRGEKLYYIFLTLKVRCKQQSIIFLS